MTAKDGVEDDTAGNNLNLDEIENKKPASIVVHTWPEHADEIRRWVRCLRAKGFDVQWRAEGLSSITWKVLQYLLRRRIRHRLTEAEKEELGRRTNFNCTACGGYCEKYDREYDHDIPLRDGGETVVLLCRQCHGLKTSREPHGPSSPLVSVFSQSAWDAYVVSPALPPWPSTHIPPRPEPGTFGRLTSGAVGATPSDTIHIPCRFSASWTTFVSEQSLASTICNSLTCRWHWTNRTWF
jgi:5-methylcytosine-specific restriction endonuclease McrA